MHQNLDEETLWNNYSFSKINGNFSLFLGLAVRAQERVHRQTKQTTTVTEPEPRLNDL